MCSLWQMQNNSLKISLMSSQPFVFKYLVEFSWYFVNSEHIHKFWGFKKKKTCFCVYYFLLNLFFIILSPFFNVQIMNMSIWSCHKSCINIVQKNGRRRPARYDNTKSLGWDYIYKQNYFDSFKRFILANIRKILNLKI